MSKDIKISGKMLEDKASKYLDRQFTLTDHCRCEKSEKDYIANGTIQRYGIPVNVQVVFKQEGFVPWYWWITDDDIHMPSTKIGTIELGRDVYITDPYYVRESRRATELCCVMPGLWDVNACIDQADSDGKRTFVLELFHQDVLREQLNKSEWSEFASITIDSESNQLSVIDSKYYRYKNGSGEGFGEDEPLGDAFFDTCCSISEDHAGIYYADNKAVGVVCSSGGGGGAYLLLINKIDFEVVAMRLEFMEEKVYLKKYKES